MNTEAIAGQSMFGMHKGTQIIYQSIVGVVLHLPVSLNSHQEDSFMLLYRGLSTVPKQVVRYLRELLFSVWFLNSHRGHYLKNQRWNYHLWLTRTPQTFVTSSPK